MLDAFHVHSASRIVVRLHMFVSLVPGVRVHVHGIDKREVNFLSSFVTLGAPGTSPSCLMDVSYTASPTR